MKVIINRQELFGDSVLFFVVDKHGYALDPDGVWYHDWIYSKTTATTKEQAETLAKKFNHEVVVDFA